MRLREEDSRDEEINSEVITVVHLWDKLKKRDEIGIEGKETGTEGLV